jgi:hypothetical protein
MDEQNLATTIRQFLRDLLGSRLTSHLEDELMRLRSDYETRLLERERTISDLREQLSSLSSKVDRYELVLLPLSSPIGSLFSPKKSSASPNLQATTEPPPTRWEEIQADWERQQAEEVAADAAAKKEQ